MFKKSFKFKISEICGGSNWLDCSVASMTILLALSKFISLTSVRSDIMGIIFFIPNSVAFCKIISIAFFFTKHIASSI